MSLKNHDYNRMKNSLNDEDIFLILKDMLTPSTYKTYLSRLKMATEFTNRSIFAIMMYPQISNMLISRRTDSFSYKKNIITAILSTFKYLKEAKKIEYNDVQNEAWSMWQKFHANLAVLETEAYKNNEPTKKQQEKYVSFADIRAKYTEMREMSKGELHQDIPSSMRFLYLSIIANTPPKRCDYGQMKIYYDKDPNKTNENYVVLHLKQNANIPFTKDSYFVFNLYKTSDVYNRVDQPINEDLKNDIIDSLKWHNRQYLFVTRLNEPFANNKAFSKFVIRTFQTLFGVNSSSTMLRHVYISEVIDQNKWSDREKENLAKLMMHSSTLQNNYRWKSKN